MTVDGPFGLFTHLAHPNNRPILMIAGGIGITSMLSMLRYMADNDDKRSLLLLWSNKTRAELIFSDEFDLIRRQLPSLRIIRIFSRELTPDDE